MSQIKYVSVREYEDGDRIITPGKSDREGAAVAIPTPDNDREDFERRRWKRVDYWRLPEPMSKSEFVEWWNENKDDEMSPIPEVLEAMGGDDADD